MPKDKEKPGQATAADDDARPDAHESDSHGEADNAQTDEGRLRPSGLKPGEGPGNLRRREQWFQKRTGNRE